jgi:hypothetical protein
MRTLPLHAGLAFFTVATLAAQDAGNGGESRAARGRVASFVCTNLPEELENPVNIMAGKQLNRILLSKFSPSDPVRIPADGILRMVRRIEPPKDPGKPEYLTLAQATVPDSVTNAVIILMPVAKNPEGLLFKTRVLDLAACKGGDSMFLNMTNLKIGVEMGKEKILVEPGEIKAHNPLGGAKAASIPIRLSFFHPERSEWAMITASTVALYSTRRELCIFNWDKRFNRVDYESITLPML